MKDKWYGFEAPKRVVGFWFLIASKAIRVAKRCCSCWSHSQRTSRMALETRLVNKWSKEGGRDATPA